MDLSILLDRDFDKNDKPFISFENENIIIRNIIQTIIREFVNFDDFNKSIGSIRLVESTECKLKPKTTLPKITKDNRRFILVDTCYAIKNCIEDFREGNTYIFTCGVFLEILQGATKKTIINGEFIKDLKKLIQIKRKLKDECVFLALGRKRRAYWTNCQPSKSCRNCVNTDTPHYKILRDVDTELFRLTTVFKCQINSCDKYLLRRVGYHSK